MNIRRYILLSLLFLLFQSVQGQSEFVCKYPEKIYKTNNTNYPGDKNIDVKYYELNLSLNPANKTIEGKVKINFKMTIPSLKEVYFDLDNNLTVDSVTSNFDQLSFTHSFNKVNISFPTNLDTSTIYSAEIYYRGKPIRSGFGGFVFDNYNFKPWIWTLSEPYAAPTWWPCKDDPSDKADSAQIIITVPDPIFAVSNGLLKSVEPAKLGTKQFKWKTDYPIANYLIAITCYDFDIYEDTVKIGNKSMPFVNYVLDSTAIDYETYFNITKDALHYFSGLLGEYPFIREKYGQVEFGYGGGMEHQTITSLGSWNEGVVVHELAHQWFGDKITCANWHEIWLNEGFATYCESLYKEHTSGFDAYSERIKIDMNRALSAVGSVYAEDISGIPSIFNLERTYSKGAVILHMLRGVVGDSIFFKILYSYANSSNLAYSNATTSDFKMIAEQIYGKDLSWFFDEWIYGEGFPDYDYSYSITNVSSGSEINFRIIQNNSSKDGKPFVMPVQLQLKGTGKDSTVTVWIDKFDNTFNFNVFFEVKDIIFDPDNFVLKRSGEIPPENLLTDELEIYPNFPNPFSGITKMKFTVKRESRIKIEMFSSLGERVANFYDQIKRPGIYFLKLDFSKIKNLSSGIYFLVVDSQRTRKVLKINYLK